MMIKRDIYRHRCRIYTPFIALLVLAFASCVWSAWQIEYTDEYLNMLSNQGEPLPPKRFGHFATRQEIIDAMEKWGREEDIDPWRIMHPAPGGFDEPGASSSGTGTQTEEKAWGEDGYGIPFYNIIKNIQQKNLERRMEKARELNQKGNDEYGKKNWAGAIKYYKEALKSSPDDPVILENLKKAEEQEKLQSLVTKGVNEYNVGNYESSVKYLQEALRIRPGDASIKEWLENVNIMIKSEEDSRIYHENAKRRKEQEIKAQQKFEAEQKKKTQEAETELTDIQAESLSFLGKPSGTESSTAKDIPSNRFSPGNLQQVHVPVPSTYPLVAKGEMDRDSPPIIKLPAEAYRIIGFVEQNIKEAPLKFGETVVTALGGGSQLGIIKIAKGLSDEAVGSIRTAVDVMERGYPESETVSLIKGSESRSMKIFVDSFSGFPTPISQEEQKELEVSGRKWFNWLTEPLGGSR